MLARTACRLAHAVGISSSLLAGVLAAGEARAATVHGTLQIGARVVQRCELGDDGEARVGCRVRGAGTVVVKLPDGSQTAPLDLAQAALALARARGGGGIVTVHF